MQLVSVLFALLYAGLIHAARDLENGDVENARDFLKHRNNRHPPITATLNDGTSTYTSSRLSRDVIRASSQDPVGNNTQQAKRQLPSTQCKAHPSTTWPSPQDWSQLKASVNGKLLQPAPAAAVCHRNHPKYNAVACDDVKTNWASSEFHSHHPTSSLWTNVNGYSCEVLDSKKPCKNDGFPVYVLNATNAQQIATAIKWANKFNVRVNVKSTGHDFLGRSTQPYSLSIWVHFMQHRVWHADKFQPKGCSFTIPGPAVTADGGTQMRRLVAYAHKYNQNIVAGSSNTVSVGGYISGGGHGIYSGKYGLAADQVLELEMVTPSGEILIANECQNTDLFWAVRGGGGSTFGVMTKVTMKTFPATSTGTWRGHINGPAGGNATWNAITAFHQAWARHLSPYGCTGYTTGNVWKNGRVSITVNLPGANSEAQLGNLMSKVMKETNAAGRGAAKMEGTSGFKAAPSARKEKSDGNDGPNLAATSERTFPGNGQNKLIASWLYGFNELMHPRLKQALMGASDNDAMLYQDFTGGPGCHKPPFLRGGGNAVGPGWRSALVRPAAELQWSGDDLNKLARRKEASARFSASLAQLNQDMGSYVNEADPDMVNIQKAFWGTNYPRLLEIKKKVDPDGVFWCKPCVGGEEWMQKPNGLLCRK